jgi:phospholipid-transporting ATPase
MIIVVYIGVGIRGLEGSQAARASDYSIGQFRFLKNLMFTHGREAYRRNSYLILYMFYKNVLYVLPIFYFGILSQFSGTSFYNEFFYQSYNILFTGAPVCWYCTFDWQYSKERLLKDPYLYRIGLKNQCFNSFIFWRWYLYAVWQSAVILFLCFNTYNEAAGNALNGDAISDSLEYTGTFIILAIVVLVNVKIFISTNTHTWLSVFWQVGSIAWYFVLYIILDFAESELRGFLGVFLTFIPNYIILFLFTSGFILVDTGIQYINDEI